MLQKCEEMQPRWWIPLICWCFMGWLSQLILYCADLADFSIRFLLSREGVNYYPLPAGGWLSVMVFVVLKRSVLFGCPHCLASSATYRFRGSRCRPSAGRALR